jgi:2-amino-4-hydroxy-6-hydroxymethyldihydropteridine diphosphokinase
MSELVVLGLGSNSVLKSEEKEFSPVEILQLACSELEKILEPKTAKFSSIYKTKAMYYENQQDFYNMVVCGFYQNSPEELLKQVNQIEAKFGRNREKEIFKGPRTLDIDIELFGNQIVKTENLEIPHKNLKERQFVLIPLLEIFPKYAEPISGAFYSDYLQNLPDQGVKFFSKFPF